MIVTAMSNTARRSLSDKTTEELKRIFLYLKSVPAINLVRTRMFDDEEREKYSLEELSSRGLLRTWQELRGVSQPRALIDMGYGIDLISFNQYKEFLAEIGEAPPTDNKPSNKPFWNRDRCELTYQGQVIRKLRSVTVAKNLAAILDAFQEDNWPDRIDSPLPGGSDSQRLRESIQSLNSGLQVIRFGADGTGEGIRWNVL